MVNNQLLSFIFESKLEKLKREADWLLQHLPAPVLINFPKSIADCCCPELKELSRRPAYRRPQPNAENCVNNQDGAGKIMKCCWQAPLP